MEFMLVTVTVVSLGLATTMSLVAWKLLHDERARKAARIEALEAMAFDSNAVSPVVPDTTEPMRSRPLVDRRPIETVEFEALAARDAQAWDLSLRAEPAMAAEIQTDRGKGNGLAGEEAAGSLFVGASETGTFSRRALALVAVGLIVAAAVATVSALRSPEVRAAVRTTAAEAPKPAVGPHPLELLSLSHTNSPAAGFTVTGLVQNPLDGRPLDQVLAVVYLFDGQGRYVATGSAALVPTAFRPGEESPFTISIPSTSDVSRYRVGFRGVDGSIVGHVDHRSQFAERTTGAEVGASDAAPVPSAATSGSPAAHEVAPPRREAAPAPLATTSGARRLASGGKRNR